MRGLHRGLLSAIQCRLCRGKRLLRGLQCGLGRNALVGKSGLLGTVELGLGLAKVGLRGLQRCLLGTVKRSLGRAKLLLCFLQSGLGANALVGNGRLLRAVERGLGRGKGLLSFGLFFGEGLGAGLQSGLLFAVKRSLGRAKVLLCFLQSRLGANALVGDNKLLRAVQRGLRGGKGLLGRRLASGKGLLLSQQACLLRAVKRVLCSVKILLGSLKRRLGADALVGRGGLLCPIQGCLGRGKGLLSFGLRLGENLLLSQQAGLLGAVKRGLRSVKILLCSLKRGLGADALVSQGGLLRAVKLRLSCRKVLVNLVLLGCELLSSALQAKLVLLACVERAAGINRGLVGQRPVAVGRSVSGSNRSGTLQHGRYACPLGHRAVYQASLGHSLLGLGTGLLHERAVLCQDGLQLTGSRFLGRVHFAFLRCKLGGGCPRGICQGAPGLNVKRICCRHVYSKRKSR